MDEKNVQYQCGKNEKDILLDRNRAGDLSIYDYITITVERDSQLHHKEFFSGDVLIGCVDAQLLPLITPNPLGVVTPLLSSVLCAWHSTHNYLGIILVEQLHRFTQQKSVKALVRVAEL